MHEPLPIVVVGAGAAGIVAAIAAATAGSRVVLLERTRDGGRKILVSGGGRCNVLPTNAAPERFVTDSSPHLLRRMLSAWPLGEQREFFEREVGIPLATEAETGKLFPASNRARDVRDRLLELAARRGVETRFGIEVRGVTPLGQRASGWTVAIAGAPSLAASAVVLATGGLSLPGTGSDGLGLEWAAALGHALHPTYPALTPLVAEPAVHVGLAGISLSVSLRAPAARDLEPEGGRPAGHRAQAAAAHGGFLFTHRGYSGPSVLDISHVAVRSRLAGRPRPLLVQWTPMDAEAWDAALQGGAGTVLGVLRRQLPERLAEALLAEAAVTGAQALARLRREERRRLVELLVRYPLPWNGDEGYAKAEVTGGGVDLREVHPRTLESRRHPGLFLCGEMLDAFGPIGGHNFSWAWSTGRTAGLGASGTAQRAASAG